MAVDKNEALEQMFKTIYSVLKTIKKDLTIHQAENVVINIGNYLQMARWRGDKEMKEGMDNMLKNK